MERSESARGAGRAAGPLWSHRAAWEEFLVAAPVEAGRSGLDLGGDWPGRWTVTWKTDGDQVSCPVRELSLIDVVSQPMRLRFDTAERRRSHTPDFLAVTRSGVWLIDVRPEHLIREEDLESFAATAEVALSCGWHYVVAARWRDHVWPALDAISSQRRPLSDPLGLRPALLASARRGLTFGELAATAAYEPLARAQLLHLIWRRQLGVNLAEPLADRSPVAAAREAAA